MLDACKEVSALSKLLEDEKCSLSEAYKLLKRTIRVTSTAYERAFLDNNINFFPVIDNTTIIYLLIMMIVVNIPN